MAILDSNPGYVAPGHCKKISRAKHAKLAKASAQAPFFIKFNLGVLCDLCARYNFSLPLFVGKIQWCLANIQLDGASLEFIPN
jgi:hypothetical protein